MGQHRRALLSVDCAFGEPYELGDAALLADAGYVEAARQWATIMAQRLREGLELREESVDRLCKALEALGRGERADIAFKTVRLTRGKAPDLETINKGYRLARDVYRERQRLGRLHQNKSGAPGAIDTVAKKNQVSEPTVQDAWDNFGKAIFQFGKDLKEPLIIPPKKKKHRK